MERPIGRLINQIVSIVIHFFHETSQKYEQKPLFRLDCSSCSDFYIFLRLHCFHSLISIYDFVHILPVFFAIHILSIKSFLEARN